MAFLVKWLIPEWLVACNVSGLEQIFPRDFRDLDSSEDDRSAYGAEYHSAGWCVVSDTSFESVHLGYWHHRGSAFSSLCCTPSLSAVTDDRNFDPLIALVSATLLRWEHFPHCGCSVFCGEVVGVYVNTSWCIKLSTYWQVPRFLFYSVAHHLLLSAFWWSSCSGFV